MFSPRFNALLKEAQFTKELLGTGATQIRLANYTTKGIYFQAFTNLSTGLERIGKLCLMLDHFIESEGSFPTLKEMKHQIGHKLELLYDRSQDVVRKRSVRLNLTRDFPGPEHLAILHVLHAFAEGDRYSNIDMLVGSNASADPVARWFNEVDSLLYATRVPKQKKDQIEYNARMGAQRVGGCIFVRHMSETDEAITDYEDSSRRGWIWEATAPYRQLAVLQVIRYWAELLEELGHAAQKIPGEDVPFFFEIFGMFCNTDTILRSRKTWDER